MKNISFYLLLILLAVSCSKINNEEEQICADPLFCKNEECLFTIDNSLGETMFLTCYGKWGVFAPNSTEDGSDLWFIVDAFDDAFKEEGLKIIFCGYVRKNSVPLEFPDPVIGQVYQINLEKIQLDKN